MAMHDLPMQLGAKPTLLCIIFSGHGGKVFNMSCQLGLWELKTTSGLLVMSVQALLPRKASLQPLKLLISGTSSLLLPQMWVGGHWG